MFFRNIFITIEKYCYAQKKSQFFLSEFTVNIRECLEAHNAKRKLHDAKPLQWNQTQAKIAQKWAIILAKTGKMEHSPFSFRKAGENLYYSATTSGSRATCKEAVEQW